MHQQQLVAIFLLRWFVPQLACYGLIALATALLNTQGKFAAPMFVPIANNLVVIGILVWFHVLVPNPSLATIESPPHRPAAARHRHHARRRRPGAAAGPVAPPVRPAGPLPLAARPRGHAPDHPAGRMDLRDRAGQPGGPGRGAGAGRRRPGPGAVSAWTYAYTFFQLPYGVIAVSVMSAVTPSLSARWAEGNLAAFRHRMAFGLRSILALVIPSAVGMIILAHPLIDLVLAHGAETSAQASMTAATLAMFALGLPGFCTFLYLVRVLQAMQDTRTAFRIYLVENAINIALAVVLVGPLGVRGLALAMSVAYSVAALHRTPGGGGKEGGLGRPGPGRPRSPGSWWPPAVMAVATVFAVNVSGATSGWRCSAGWCWRWSSASSPSSGPPWCSAPARTGGRWSERAGRGTGAVATVHAGPADRGGPTRPARSDDAPASPGGDLVHPSDHPGADARSTAPGPERPDDRVRPATLRSDRTDAVPWQTRRRGPTPPPCATCARYRRPGEPGVAPGDPGERPGSHRTDGRRKSQGPTVPPDDEE